MDYREIAFKLIKSKYDVSKDLVVKGLFGDYLKKLKTQYGAFCVFGAGSLGIDMIDLIKSFGLEVDYVCDNNYEQIRNRFSENPQPICFDDLCKIKDKCLVFVSPSNGPVKANTAINLQLQKSNFDHVISTPIWKNMVYLLREIGEVDKEYFLDRVMQIIDWCEDDFSKRVFTAVLEQLFCDYRTVNIVNNIEEYYDPHQYFTDFVGKRSDECFVDCGAFVGDTFELFYQWSGGEYEKYYGFELDPKNLKRLRSNIYQIEKNHSRIELFGCGLHDKNEKMKAYLRNDTSYVMGTNSIGYDASEIVELKTLDDCLEGRKVTFLKMDIENSEIPALYGARKIITEQKPLCAISNYHGLKQLIEVPAILKSMNPEYRIRLRAHSTVGHDIVCYAMDQEDNRNM
ncbi:methyltransferase, FkbM family [[Clostridium] aminophilum]|uniref:Methyltransferase, FkbM family n=1 Tax=[Clostridium] aminophilum TaxID=1526 RepID=A0A1I0EDN9_9FIRM|nr:FkbM family methyltransferase [[Clostridium] aminophilum]SET43338.1 methyltransferase, FkbM family [[Clostridium] aminophilum]